MAGRNDGTGASEAGKVGKSRLKDNQRRLVLEEGKSKIRVTFSEGADRKEE